jgi:hypothetical protein
MRPVFLMSVMLLLSACSSGDDSQKVATEVNLENEPRLKAHSPPPRTMPIESAFQQVNSIDTLGKSDEPPVQSETRLEPRPGDLVGPRPGDIAQRAATQ